MLNRAKNAKTALAVAVLLLSAAGIAQAQEYQEADAGRPTPEQAEKLMKQSQMSVDELIKNGIIEDAKRGSDTGDYKPPSQDDLQQQAIGTQGDRAFMPQSQNGQFGPQSQVGPQSQYGPQSPNAPHVQSALGSMNDPIPYTPLSQRSQYGVPLPGMPPTPQNVPRLQSTPQPAVAPALNYSRPTENTIQPLPPPPPAPEKRASDGF